MSTKTMAACLTAALAFSGAASADNGWYFSLSGGADNPVGGDVLKGNAGTVTDLAPLNPGLAGQPGTFAIDSTSWHDFYATSPLVQGELGYNFSDDLRAYARLGYVWDTSKTLQNGTALIPAVSASALPLFTRLGDYDAWLLSVGGRYAFGHGALKPYIGADIGAAFVDSIDATMTVPGAGIAIANTKLFDSTTAFTGGAEIGVTYDVSPGLALGGSVGYRYIGGLDATPDGLSSLGMGNVNAGHRSSVPIAFNIMAKF